MNFKQAESIPFYKAVQLFEARNYESAIPLFIQCLESGNIYAAHYLNYLLEIDQYKDEHFEKKLLQLATSFKPDAWLLTSLAKQKLKENLTENQRLQQLRILTNLAPYCGYSYSLLESILQNVSQKELEKYKKKGICLPNKRIVIDLFSNLDKDELTLCQQYASLSQTTAGGLERLISKMFSKSNPNDNRILKWQTAGALMGDAELQLMFAANPNLTDSESALGFGTFLFSRINSVQKVHEIKRELLLRCVFIMYNTLIQNQSSYSTLLREIYESVTPEDWETLVKYSQVGPLKIYQANLVKILLDKASFLASGNNINIYPRNFKAALDILLELADKGYSGEAACRIGVFYQKGVENSFDVNTPLAIKFFLKAMQLGYDKAYENLESIYSEPSNQKYIQEHYDSLLNQDTPIEKSVLEAIHEYCIFLGSTDEYFPIQLSYLCRLSQKGLKIASYNLSKTYLRSESVHRGFGKDVLDAFNITPQKIEAYLNALIDEPEFLEAYSLLALLHREHRMTDNPAKYIEYAKMGAQKGDLECLYLLGVAYDLGIGTEPCDPLAYQYYTQAADKGHVLAASNLGSFYLKGRGLEAPDLDKAERYLQQAEKATQQQEIHIAAKQAIAYNLSCLYSKPEKCSYEKAFRYISMADQEDVDVLKDLGVYYAHGWGVEINIKKSIDCFTKAQQKGCAVSETYVAGLLLRNWIDNPDWKSGPLVDIWFTLEKSKNMVGQFWFGIFKLILQIDKQEAIDLFNKVATSQDIKADRELAQKVTFCLEYLSNVTHRVLSHVEVIGLLNPEISDMTQMHQFLLKMRKEIESESSDSLSEKAIGFEKPGKPSSEPTKIPSSKVKPLQQPVVAKDPTQRLLEKIDVFLENPTHKHDFRRFKHVWLEVLKLPQFEGHVKHSKGSGVTFKASAEGEAKPLYFSEHVPHGPKRDARRHDPKVLKNEKESLSALRSLVASLNP